MKPRPDHVTFRINPDDKARLRKLAEAERRTVSQLLAIIVEGYLAEADKAAERAATKKR